MGFKDVKVNIDNLLQIMLILIKNAHKLIKRPDVKIIIAIFDQLIMTGTHFIINVVVARQFSINYYGKFAVAYATLVFMYMIHSAVVAEPAAVVEIKDREGLVSYISGVIYSYALAVFIVIILCIYIVSFLGFTSVKENDHSAFIIACATSYFYWTGKAVSYRIEKPEYCIISTIAYSAFILIGVGVGYFIFKIKISPFWFISFGATIAGLILLVCLSPFQIKKRLMNYELKAFYRYGLWGLPSAVVIWVVNNVHFYMICAFRGYEETGALKAIINILVPVSQMIHGASLFLLPWLAQHIRNGDILRFKSRMKVVMNVTIAATLSFGIISSLFSVKILKIVYGDDYSRFGDALSLAALTLPVLWGVSAVLRTAFRALGKPDKVLYAYLGALLPIGLPAMIIGAMNGVIEVVSSIVVVQFISCGIFIHFWRTNESL